MAHKGGETAILADELAALVGDRIHFLGLTRHEAAHEIGLSPATLSRILSGKPPEVASFVALLRWLDISADVFIRREHEINAAGEIEARVRQDPNLPTATAKALANLIRAVYDDYADDE